MFNVGGGEILVIALLALIVLGPDKLPETARKLGRYLNEFRRMTSGFQEEFRQAMDLSGTSSANVSDSSSDDAVHRATPGPRLLAAPEIPTAPSEPAAASSEADAAAPEPAQGTTSSSSGRAAFAADVTPAPGTGPQLVTPPRPDAAPADGTGSSSAA